MLSAEPVLGRKTPGLTTLVVTGTCGSVSLHVAMTSNPLEAILQAGELRRLLLGWFLWAPTALLVPAVGWVGTPLTFRLALGLGLGLGLAVAPYAAPSAAATHGFWLELGRALLLGCTVGVGVAAVFWAALMVGGVADRMGRLRAEATQEVLPQGSTSLLFGLLTALFFLAGGGVSRVSSALAELAWSSAEGLAARMADTCVASITLAVTVATPVLLATLLLEGVSGLVARSAPPLVVDALLGPLKALAFLLLLALALEPMMGALAEAWGTSR